MHSNDDEHHTKSNRDDAKGMIGDVAKDEMPRGLCLLSHKTFNCMHRQIGHC